MSADKTTPTIGKLLTGDEKRDAIHIAVAPVVAGSMMRCGSHVGLFGDGRVGFVDNGKEIGIVDPYLKEVVNPGDRFWLFLYPGTITSLRHAWTHPAFLALATNDEDAPTKEVEKALSWLRWYVKRYIKPYCDTPDEALETFLADLAKGRVYSYGSSQNNSASDLDPELWERLAVIGVVVNPNTLSFSCSC